MRVARHLWPHRTADRRDEEVTQDPEVLVDDLPVIAEAAATGETADLYAEIRGFFGLGFVPDVFQLTSTRPSFQHTFWHGYQSMFTEGLLERETRELIAAFVARDAGCQYCVDAHVLLVELVGGDPEVARAIRGDAVDDMPVEPKVRELLHFVRHIDHEAYRITDAAFEQLRRSGWSDAELLEAIWTERLFNGIVRLVDTLGLYRLGQLVEGNQTASAEAAQ